MTGEPDLGPVPQHIEYDLTSDDYVAFNEHVSLTIPEYRQQVAQVRIWGALLMLVFTGTMGVALSEDGAVVPLVIAVLIAVGWWMTSPWWLRRAIRRRVVRIAATSGLGVLGPTSVSADAGGLRAECGGVVNTAPWSAILRVEDAADHGFIFVGPVAAIIVPKRAAGAPALLAAVRERIGRGGLIT